MGYYSISKVGTFNTCKAKYRLQYDEKLRKILPDNRNLNVGSMVHVGLAAAMRSYHASQNAGQPIEIMQNDAFGEAHLAMNNWYNENIPDTEFVVPDPITGEVFVNEKMDLDWQSDFELAERLVYRTLSDVDVPGNYTVVSIKGKPAVEFRVETLLPNQQIFVGYVDVLLQDKVTGLVHLIDWKTKSRFMDEVDFEFDGQMPLYAWAVLQQYDIFVGYVEMYQILKKLPGEPKVNKNGALSKAKNIKTDWATYEQTAVVNKANDPLLNSFTGTDVELREYIRTEAYPEMFEYLQGEVFFKSLRRSIPYHLLEVYVKNFSRNVDSVVFTTEWPFVWSAFVCNGCQFRQFCSAIVQGSDPENLIGTVYERQEENE
jgi:hypothetical protein